jgi:hypothetical protein
VSDDFDQFMRDTNAMFDRVEDQVEKIHHIFILKMAWRVIDTTPGFGNQDPADTPYIPTGQLRGGWNLQSEPGGETSKYDGGPRSDYGVETMARVSAQLDRFELKGDLYLVNDIAYGYIVHWGLGRHKNRRRWVEEAANKGSTYLAEAVSEVMS